MPSIGCKISDPVSKAKSVTFTEDGLREAERRFRELFAGGGYPGSARPEMTTLTTAIGRPTPWKSAVPGSVG